MMHFHDHIIAGLVGSIVLLLIISIQHRGHEANIEAGLFYANRAQTLGLIEMIERDFPNIGSGVEPGSQPMLADYAWTEQERYFEFLATVDSTADAPVERIRYEVVPAQAEACTRAQVDCFEVRRLVWNGSSFAVSGRSQSTLTDFEIQLLPTPTALESVREVDVRFAAISPLGEDQITRRTTWQTRYTPFSLSLQAP